MLAVWNAGLPLMATAIRIPQWCVCLGVVGGGASAPQAGGRNVLRTSVLDVRGGVGASPETAWPAGFMAILAALLFLLGHAPPSPGSLARLRA